MSKKAHSRPGPESEDSASDAGGNLGAFGGVFAPSILTILGIIFYLRTGYVVGEVGLGDALLIITFCYLISILTSLSLAAVATSMEVKGGGFYYVISRTLGIEFGGALGLVLFLSISIGIAFYAIGLGEVVAGMDGVPDVITPQWVAIAVIVLLFGFAWAGADVATQLQYGVMAIVFASIVAIGWGGYASFDAELAIANTGTMFAAEGDKLDFWGAFALFFPAITGFTQGLNMSGDLKKPTRDIPVGTLTAVALSYLLYAGLAILMAGTASAEALSGDYLILETISPIAWIVTAGVIAATASSAMASFLGAPRIAQALGSDEVFPGSAFFAKGAGASNNPRRAVLLSAAIALGAVAIGNLNFLAPIITMFFLASYALLNYATFYVARAHSPSFRPTFRAYHRYLSLAGVVACTGAMLAIDLVASIVAVLAMVSVHLYLKRRGEKAAWADSKRAFGFQRMREQLFELKRLPEHPSDWRPQILLIARDDVRRLELLRFSQWIEASSGLTSVVSIIDAADPEAGSTADEEAALQQWIEDAGVEAFSLALRAPDLHSGLSVLLQAYGIGPLKANTLLLNGLDPIPDGQDDPPRYKVLGEQAQTALSVSFNVIILNATASAIATDAEQRSEAPRIDIWWCGGATGDFMLLLGYLMTRASQWEEAELRILAQARQDHPELTESRLDEMLETVRIDARVELIEQINIEVVRQYSADAAICYLPVMVDEQANIKALFDLDIDEVSKVLPVSVLCIAGGGVQLAADPDDVSGDDSASEP